MITEVQENKEPRYPHLIKTATKALTFQYGKQVIFLKLGSTYFFGKRRVPLDNFPLEHFPYPAQLGFELVGLGLELVRLGENVRYGNFQGEMSNTTLVSLRKRGSMFLPALVCLCACVSDCDHDNEKDCRRICTKFYGKVPRANGKTKFVFRYDR